MTVHLGLLLIAFSGLITVTLQSIAGLTYMDNFDFETRYRNADECNPFYWHPLHLPENCMRIYENLIRRGLGSVGPARVVKERQPLYVIEKEEFSNGDYDDSNDGYQAPYKKMLQLLQADVARQPSYPNITVFPGLGIVALYKQPVSKKSGDYIKKTANAYKEFSFVYRPMESEKTTKELASDDQKDNNHEVALEKNGTHHNIANIDMNIRKVKKKQKYKRHILNVINVFK